MGLFTAQFGGDLRQLQVHRWRYALAEASEGSAYVWDTRRRLGLVGDALVGARVEAAWQSGQQMAAAIAGSELVSSVKNGEELVGVSRAV